METVPFADKKYGSDTGIDGPIYFKPEGKTTEPTGPMKTKETTGQQEEINHSPRRFLGLVRQVRQWH